MAKKPKDKSVFTNIPTKYKSTQFRSRLEAKWAAFFDLLGWKWEYEPIDLNGYIPDFILPDFKRPLLVEVKPCLAIFDLYQHADKIRKSNWRDEFLIVGSVMDSGPTHVEELYPTIGALCGPVNGCDWAVLFECDTSARTFGICGQFEDHTCRRCGEIFSEEHGSKFDVDAMWREAGNAVQWKAQS